MAITKEADMDNSELLKQLIEYRNGDITINTKRAIAAYKRDSRGYATFNEYVAAVVKAEQARHVPPVANVEQGPI